MSWGLGYHHLQPGLDDDGSEGLVEALTAPALARPVAARVELRPLFAGLALLLLLARHAGWVSGWAMRLARRATRRRQS